MISDKFMVNSEAGRMAAARYVTENFAWQAKLDKKDTLRLDLLVEETLGMARTMLTDFYGQLWFVGEGKRCEIHFEATADMNADKKEELLSVSSTGKNAAAKGFMGKLGELITGAIHGIGRSIDTYGQETIQYGVIHTPGMSMGASDIMPIWTLQNYRSDLDRAQDEDEAAGVAQEELEKSIVASLADDIIVGVRGDRIDMVIIKTF